MNKISFIIIFLIGFQFQLSAQYDGEGNNEISRFRPGSMWFFSGLTPYKTGKLRKYDRLIFDITYNDWVGDISTFKNKWNSIGLNSAFMFDIPITQKNTMSFAVGLSHSIFVISHKNSSFAHAVDGEYTTYTTNINSPYKNQFLAGNSLSIPLEFRFRNKGWKHFKFHIGAKVGYQLEIHSKNVYKGDHGLEKVKSHDFPDVTRFIYSAHCRIGMRNWAVFASYNFNPIFKSSQSPKLNLLQLGLSVSLF